MQAPSTSIQQKAAIRKYCMRAATVTQAACKESSSIGWCTDKREFIRKKKQPSQAYLKKKKKHRRINNVNWTEWSATWAEIIGVISELNERAARVGFEITSMISDQNCTTRGPITTLLYPFWNRSNTGLGKLKNFIDAVLSWFEIKFIHFLEGKSNSLGNKRRKIYHVILFVSNFTAIWLVTLNKPWNLFGCFVFSVAFSLAGKKMWFKTRNGAIRA